MARVCGSIMVFLGTAVIVLSLAAVVYFILVLIVPVIPRTLWVLVIAWFALSSPVILLPAGFILRKTGALLAQREVPGSTCPRCAYDLRGGAPGGCCPECGFAFRQSGAV
jgi:hypothetical protein